MELIIVLVLLWVVWLIWNGRSTSPRAKKRNAHIDELMRQAVEEKTNKETK